MKRRLTLVTLVVAGTVLFATSVHQHEVSLADKDELVPSQTEPKPCPEPVELVTLTDTGSSVYVPPEPVQEVPYDPCARDEWGSNTTMTVWKRWDTDGNRVHWSC